ncbi:Flp family type IVb pilin [Desulfuromonas sp. TF]|jgi:pilus assembly protein Flp/PilA|uniref:Flp family type IVb pilin n=1 Tax=Desulfuromonas sp. TF TaxID=1232410 RepID=UPI00041A9B09|nr:hypothetical protein [Desulfuromonas sp. TF]
MQELWTGIKRFLVEEEGATATEYAVMLALIILIALGAIVFLGQRVTSGFSTVASAISTAGS